MAQDGHNMEASVRVKVDADGIQSMTQVLSEQNQKVENLTQNYKELATAMKQASNASKNTSNESENNAELSRLMRIRQSYQAGLKSHDEYVREIKKGEESLRKELAKMNEDDKGFDTKLNQYRAYQTEVERIEKANTQIVQREAKAQSSYINKEISQSISSYGKLNQQIQQMAASSKSTLGGDMFNSMLSMGVLNQITNALGQVTSSISDINYNTINNIRLMGDLGDKTKETSDYLTQAAIESAKTTGTQITDAQQIQGAWIRINDEYAKSPELLTKISQLTSEFMNVGEIEDGEKAVALLNASLLQLKDDTQDTASAAQEFLDKWAYMADVTAMGTADEYGEAISKFGAQLKNVGGDMDDAITQSSILADHLALTGSEIGNALKTFNTYLTRTKTISLFSDIAAMEDDVSYKLQDDNGKLKDYRDILNTVSDAYVKFKNEGNDALANSILDAVGATRRRDVATAMLEASAGGQNSEYQRYLDKVQGGDSTGYIEEQNAKLMETLKNQWNSLIVSMTGAGMSLANSGILDSLTQLMQFGGNVFDEFSKLPQPVLQFVTTLGELKLGLAGLKKIGEITGLSNELSASFKSGTKAQREMAAATSDSVASFEKQQQAVLTANSGLYNTTQTYRDAQLVTLDYAEGVQSLAEQYTEGKITATQYTEGVHQLTDAYQSQLAGIQEVAQANENKAKAELEDANTTKENTQAEVNNAKARVESARTAGDKAKAEGELAAATEKNSAAAKNCQEKEKAYTNAIKENKAAQDINKKSIDNLAKSNEKATDTNKKATVSSKQEANALKEQQAASEGASNGAKKAATSNETFSISNVIATTTTKLFTSAVGALKAVLGTLLNPVNLILTAITLLAPKFLEATNESEKLQNQLDSMEDQLSDTKERIQELQELRENRGLTTGETQELVYLKQKNTELEKSIRLTEQSKKNSEYTKHQGGVLGIGGTNSGHEDVQQSIRDFNKLQTNIKALQQLINDPSQSQYKDSYVKKLNEDNEKFAESAAAVISKYHELKDAIDNGEYSGSALTQANEDLKQLESLLPSAQLLIESVDNTGYSFKSAADKAEEYAQAIEDASTIAEAASKKYNAFDSAVGAYKENGYLTDDQVLSLVGNSQEFANLVEWTGDHWKLVDNYEEIAKQYQQELTEQTVDYVNNLKEGNKQTEQQSENINKLSEAFSGTKTMVSDINQMYKGVDGVQTFADSVNEIQDNFANGKITLDEYNSKMRELTEDTDFSMILSSQDEINQMSGQQLQQMYAQQEMWQALLSDAGTTLSTITEQYNNGEMSQEEYAVALAGVNDRFLELALASGIIKQTSDGFVDADGNTVQWANDLSTVSSVIGSIGGLFSDNMSTVNQLLNGSTEEAQNACNTLANSFNTTMATLKATNDGTWTAVITKMAEVKGMNVSDFLDKFVSDSGTMSSEVTGDVDVMKAAFGELSTQMTSKLDKAQSDGSSSIDTLKNNVSSKMNTAATSAKKHIQSIQDAIDKLHGKDIKITVNYQEKNKPSSVGGDNVNGNASFSDGNAFASGTIGSDYSGNTLVGELGTELLVRGNHWTTIGDNGAEFVPIRKGDIVFNHEQTKELLAHGRVTSGSGRGKAYASGTAFASGSKYSSSYKITDDADVANTKAVQKYAREAERIIAQAVAAGENISDELREAAQNAEKIAKDVESYTSKYISNVESLQKRAANALEDHYKQEADDRKKLLEKDHNAKLDAIDEEIARLKGDTTEDKEKQLSDLQGQLSKWKNDNSSLGKKKQKELQDQIDDLDKEIKIDKLEKQRDAENDSYKASIDSDSDAYDTVLKDLDNKMTDENLYKTVNDLIKKNDVDTLTKLLTKHDSQWDGWQTLNGKSAGDVIGDEVRNAINNYNDVVRGTINQNGGASSANSGASAASSAPAPAKTASIGSTVNAGSATIYSTSYGGGGGRQYYSSDPVYTIVGENNGYWLVRYHKLSSGYTGWFKKSEVTAMKTGGYTGNNEGMAMLHAKERVLNAQQTAAFEKLVYNLLPTLSTDMLNGNTNNTTNNNGNVFNKELVSVNVGQIVNNTPFDVKNTEDNLDRVFRASLKKSGVNLKVK